MTGWEPGDLLQMLHPASEHPDGCVPNPLLITVALNFAELEGPEVDVACGGVEPMVDQWEDPAHPLLPTRHQLELLAELTGRDPDWFYGPDPTPAGVVFICYSRKVDGARCHVSDGMPVRPAADPGSRTSSTSTRSTSSAPRRRRADSRATPDGVEPLPGMPAGSGREAARKVAADARALGRAARDARLRRAGW